MVKRRFEIDAESRPDLPGPGVDEGIRKELKTPYAGCRINGEYR